MNDKDKKTLTQLNEYIEKNPEEGREIMQQINAIWDKIQKKESDIIEVLGDEEATRISTQQTIMEENGSIMDEVLEEITDEGKKELRNPSLKAESSQEVSYKPVDCTVYVFDNNGEGTRSLAYSYSNKLFSEITAMYYGSNLHSERTEKRMILVKANGNCVIVISPKQLVDYPFGLRVHRFNSLAIHLTNDQLLSLGNINEDTIYKMETGENLDVYMSTHHGRDISKIMIPFIKAAEKNTSKEEEFWKLITDFCQSGKKCGFMEYGASIHLTSNSHDLTFYEMLEQAKILGRLAKRGELKENVVLFGAYSDYGKGGINHALFQGAYSGYARGIQGNALNVNINYIDKKMDYWLALDIKNGLCSKENYIAVKDYLSKLKKGLNNRPYEKRLEIKRKDFILKMEITEQTFNKRLLQISNGVQDSNKKGIEDLRLAEEINDSEENLDEVGYNMSGDNMQRKMQDEDNLEDSSRELRQNLEKLFQEWQESSADENKDSTSKKMH